MDRTSIDSQYKWDLESIYSDAETFNKDVKKVKEYLEIIKKNKGDVLSSANKLYDVLELELKIERILSKLFVFCNLNYTLDTRDSKWSKEVSNISDLYSKISSETSFIESELSKLTYDLLRKFIVDLPELKKYEFSLSHLIKMNAHILSEKEETLISKLAPVIDAGSEIFDKLDNADVNFGNVQDKDGNNHELTNGSYREFVGSSDRVLRKNALNKLHEFYEKHKNSISECLNNHIKSDVIISKIKNYNSSLEASLSQDDISVEFYKNFIASVNKNLPILHRMMNVYKEALGVDQMHIYDINARIGKFERKLSIPEIKTIVEDSLKIMGEDYIRVVKEAFTKNWVDFYETPGKMSGAFSSGSYDTKPYILLNYTGGFDDVETLAHELGHSIHSYYSKKSRGPHDADYPIFLAEIASTTHEVLLNHYLLETCKNKDERIFILNNILTNYKSTIFRQTEFAEFELITHDLVKKGENLSSDEFTNIYETLQKKYYGPNVVIDDMIKYEALRIPHFYTSFYVYKYAVGLACAYKFAGDIINKKENSIENYIKFISSGGKDYPKNILKECGIDLDNYDVLLESIKIIENYIDEFEKLIKEQ